MTLVKSIKNVLDRLLEGLVMIVVAVLVVDVLWQVFTRFVLNKPSTWNAAKKSSPAAPRIASGGTKDKHSADRSWPSR